MKVQSFFRLCVTVCIVVFFVSCNKNNKQGRYVPKDAAIVIVADGKSLSSKLSWDDIKQDSLFQKLYADSSTTSSLKNILNNPDSSGIDIKSDLIFFVQKDSAGGYLALEGTIKDASLFKSFNQQITDGGTESDKDNASYISHYPSCVGWNKERFIYVFDMPALNKMDDFSRRMTDDGIDASKNRDIGATCKSLFDLEENNSLAKNEKFSKLMKETGDVYFWANTETFYKASSSPLLSMMNLDEFTKDNISTGVLNFDNGKISLSFNNYLNDKLLDLYKKYKGDKINEDMLKRIPGKEIQGAMAFSFNPELIKQLLAETNTDGILNMGLSQFKLTVTDFVNAFKGDFVIGLSDFKMKIDSTTDGIFGKTEIPIPDYNFIFAATIDDKDALNKILNAYKNLPKNQGDNNISKNNFSDTSNSAYYVLSNKKENTDQFLNGNSSSNFNFINKINEQPFGFYFNIHSLLKECNNMAVQDSSYLPIYNASLNFWNTISIKSGEISNGTITSSMEINLVDSNTNSLKQLHQYIAAIGSAYKEKEKMQTLKEDALIKDDSQTLPMASEKKNN